MLHVFVIVSHMYIKSKLIKKIKKACQNITIPVYVKEIKIRYLMEPLMAMDGRSKSVVTKK